MRWRWAGIRTVWTKTSPASAGPCPRENADRADGRQGADRGRTVARDVAVSEAKPSVIRPKPPPFLHVQLLERLSAATVRPIELPCIQVALQQETGRPLEGAAREFHGDGPVRDGRSPSGPNQGLRPKGLPSGHGPPDCSDTSLQYHSRHWTTSFQ